MVKAFCCHGEVGGSATVGLRMTGLCVAPKQDLTSLHLVN